MPSRQMPALSALLLCVLSTGCAGPARPVVLTELKPIERPRVPDELLSCPGRPVVLAIATDLELLGLLVAALEVGDACRDALGRVRDVLGR
jgi:hypothetical protein